jgi:hypothetical protein
MSVDELGQCGREKKPVGNCLNPIGFSGRNIFPKVVPFRGPVANGQQKSPAKRRAWHLSWRPTVSLPSS